MIRIQFKMDNLILFYMTICLVAGTALYTYGTGFRKIITINRKFSTSLHDDEDDVWNIPMISDTSGNDYQLCSSFWHFKFAPVGTWIHLVKGETYHVEGYGVRIPSLGMYPNIVSAKLQK